MPVVKHGEVLTVTGMQIAAHANVTVTSNLERK